MAKTPPAFQFYPERFIVGTQGLTAAEVGAYIRLLCHEWIYNSVPGDSLKRLAPIMGMSSGAAKAAWAVLSVKFVRGDDGEWRNGMIERVRAEQEQYRTTKAVNGHKGGRPRGAKNNLPVISRFAFVPEKETPPYSVLSDPDPSKNEGSGATPHPVKAFLALHERLFRERYGVDPAGYTGRDAKHAKDVIRALGESRANALLEQFFRSRDKFIQESGHSLGVFVSVQNKLIAETSGRHRALADPRVLEQRRKTERVRELMAGGMSMAEANRLVFDGGSDVH